MRSLPTIEVFQDLSFSAVDGDWIAQRDALINKATGPWHHDTEMEARVVDAGVRSGNTMLALRRDGDESIPAAVVTLFPEGHNGYKVTNIVPRETHALTERQYNAVLDDFIKRVVMPAAPDCDVRLSKDRESPRDWTSEAAANALWAFSLAANKSTGSAHPMDRARWMAFIVEHHRSGTGNLNPSLLARWLVEADDWPDDTAHDLAIEFESAIELLTYYDEHH
ncbi:hypothetical protein ADU20_17400 [Burkholderia pseudomallei]|uniref:hypothetical protein n=1 Tax=Burkholderia pseudomallei TaxID=28450 RepID=UPI000680DFB1|nr:hypothetical protein [Burkholderia pseudomallei]KNA32834.1 hypothetical protein ADU20_17400 [Burkholderia pseudomallei]